MKSTLTTQMKICSGTGVLALAGILSLMLVFAPLSEGRISEKASNATTPQAKAMAKVMVRIATSGANQSYPKRFTRTIKRLCGRRGAWVFRASLASPLGSTFDDDEYCEQVVTQPTFENGKLKCKAGSTLLDWPVYIGIKVDGKQQYKKGEQLAPFPMCVKCIQHKPCPNGEKCVRKRIDVQVTRGGKTYIQSQTDCKCTKISKKPKKEKLKQGS